MPRPARRPCARPTRNTWTAWSRCPPGPLSLDALAAGVNQRLPADACVTVGAGNYALYPHRYRQFAGPGTSLAPTLGAMGYTCRRPCPPSSNIRSARWSATPATAASR